MSEQTITVCSECLQASCWQGEFYCDNARTAGTVEKTRAELEALALEHPHYWGSVSTCNSHERVYEDGSGYICRHCCADMDDED